MSGLLGVLLLAGAARVETFGLGTVDSNPALRVYWSGVVGRVLVERVGEETRVSLEGAELGALFSGASRFELRTASLPSDLPPNVSAPIEGVRIETEGTSVSLSMRLPAGVALDVRRGSRGVALVFARAPEAASPVLQAVAPPVATPSPIKAAETPAPEPQVPAPPPTPEPSPAAEVRVASLAAVDRLTNLFPVPALEPTPSSSEGAAAAATGGESLPTGDLYRKLFPNAPAEPSPETAPSLGVPPTPRSEPEPGWAIGSFRLKPTLGVSYIDADVAVGSPQPEHDRYVQFHPGLSIETPIAEGRLAVEYFPVLRALGSFEPVQSSSQSFGASLDLPLGQRVTLGVREHFATGVLETTEVDPGREYFFDLGRFNRNAVEAEARISVAPRLSVDLAGGVNRVRFQEPSGFFDYDSRSVAAGLGFDLTPTVHATLGYVYDRVPRPDQRPEAESRAHGAQVVLDGEILPELRGRVALGYRDQASPNAGPDGQRFGGFVFSGSLARELGRGGSVSLGFNRATPVSAFEENGFYVSNSVQARVSLPLPYAFSLESGAGFLLNQYPTNALELGEPRKDRAFGFFLGLRRPISRWFTFSAAYRRDERNSNLAEFDSEAAGIVLRLDVNLFPERR